MPRDLHAHLLYPIGGLAFATSSAAVLVQVETGMSRLVVLASSAILAMILGLAIARREAGLRSASMTDPLTGLHNRRYFEECLEREVHNARRHRKPMALLVIDLDHLKAINDGLGHHAGDAALGVVADTLRKACRRGDLPARWGGDEFVVLAPQTTAEQAEALVQRINAVLPAQSAAAHESMRTRGRQSAPEVTASIGFAIASSDQPSSLWPVSLFAAADRAMYRKKCGIRRITGPLLKLSGPEGLKASNDNPLPPDS